MERQPVEQLSGDQTGTLSTPGRSTPVLSCTVRPVEVGLTSSFSSSSMASRDPGGMSVTVNRVGSSKDHTRMPV